ncbi:MBL fold metallo-hydrolase [Rhodococcus opacus]|uniref:MBL fold metallo-hydrolase n=1 Tax=Rhodococcus opacus TaxID=37919 RepID=UPI000EA9E312|nr:MBL fold metallo-hydrolase [Rhodococcus opacus]QZS52765.1 MBL fold metallo-hydrolase [Rhodococcus opacus]RKM65236.1 MBL fold metallo-hydrolase [Rhodococcus opacus]
MRFGDIEVLPVLDGIGREDPHHILTRPGIDDPWSTKAEALDEHGVLDFDIGGFLIRTGDRIVVVDTGVGTIDDKLLGHGGRYTGGKFLDSLRAHGVAPEEVTDVLLTHLHFDHVGWTTQKGKIVFPGATYRAHRLDWEHFVTSPEASPGAVRKLSPITDQLELFDQDTTLAPGVDALHSPGHTPGSTVFVVSGEGRRGYLLGDVVHSTVELEEPDWRAIFDEDPELASQTRNRLADEIAASGDLVAGAHFPGLNFGRMVLTDGQRRFRAL